MIWRSKIPSKASQQIEYEAPIESRSPWQHEDTTSQISDNGHVGGSRRVCLSPPEYQTLGLVHHRTGKEHIAMEFFRQSEMDSFYFERQAPAAPRPSVEYTSTVCYRCYCPHSFKHAFIFAWPTTGGKVLVADCGPRRSHSQTQQHTWHKSKAHNIIYSS